MISESLRPIKLLLILERVNNEIVLVLCSCGRGSSLLDLRTLRIGLYLDKYQFSLLNRLSNLPFEQTSITVIEKLVQPKVLKKKPKKLRCLAPL